jgi:mannose-6-phosphate isomerase
MRFIYVSPFLSLTAINMPYKLTGKIQHYAWGGCSFIPQLLHLGNPDKEPFAEYWLGAHDKAPSTLSVEGKKTVPLNELISSDPEKYLGSKTAGAFGRLPFLFKVLDVREMLSIQVHPDKAEAEKGFARENAAGIPLDAPDRNYKDDNHKPEMMVALSEFYLLHGFLPETPLREMLNNVPELRSLYTYFDKKGYQALYAHVMNMPRFRVKEILGPLLKRVLPLYKQGKLSKTTPDFWAARAVDSGMTTIGDPDKGIFSIYFFNLVRLNTGEGIFQGAGMPHAYLEGQNVELMANSDNVLRGGLTPKHVDVDELLKHTRFEGLEPNVLKGHPDGKEKNYPAPVNDFMLTKIEINKGESFDNQASAPTILLLISGGLSVTGAGELTLKQGESLFILPGEAYKLTAMDNTLIYSASVPVHTL